MAESAAFWRDRPVFVTGATGLLGPWVVRRLLEAEAEVAVLIRDWVPESELLAGGEIERVRVVRGDIRDRETLERALGEYEIDTVFHLAAQTIVGVANRNPLSTFESNIRGTWELLEACRRSPAVRSVIVASSDKAYGEHQRLPYSEDAPLQGRHPYDVSKSCADLIAQSYAATFDLPVAITRCGNFFGGGDLNWSRLVPGTIRSVIRGEPPVVRSDGQYVRDYLYVEDGAEACLLLARHLAEHPEMRGEAFNFSNELQLTVLDLVERILRVMQSDLRPDVRSSATHEIRRQYLTAAKARAVLGWEPRFTLEEGLERTVAWYRGYLEGRGG